MASANKIVIGILELSPDGIRVKNEKTRHRCLCLPMNFPDPIEASHGDKVEVRAYDVIENPQESILYYGEIVRFDPDDPTMTFQ